MNIMLENKIWIVSILIKEFTNIQLGDVSLDRFKGLTREHLILIKQTIRQYILDMVLESKLNDYKEQAPLQVLHGFDQEDN